ncbi:MAG: 5-formyltetrahydrofolate cyclo-ligase [Acutalibacter sp.]|jgi:5-formyltetrahydrofolate cyclo-ligase
MGGLKSALRKELAARRNALPDRAAKSRAIQDHVRALPGYLRAEKLLLYLSMGSEVDTWGIFQSALSCGKAVYAPRCLDGEGHMAFYRVKSREELKQGRFGLWEPDPTVCAPLTGTDGALCLVPGLAFDEAGFRLGYGKGYYDRFLANHPVETVGLCYGELLLPQLPREALDRRVSWLVTEAGAKAAEAPGPGKEGCV